MEPYKMTDEGIRGRYFREFYCKIVDNFPEEDVDCLRKHLAMKGEAWWQDWLLLHHDEILDFLRAMPDILRTPLNYQKNGLLIHAAVLYLCRAVYFLGFVDAASPCLSWPPQGEKLATLANIFDQMTYSDPPPLWVLEKPSPFA
jgi:hypothetical protein